MTRVEQGKLQSEKPEITLVSPPVADDSKEQKSQLGNCAPQCIPYCRIQVCRPTCGIILPPPPRPQ